MTPSLKAVLDRVLSLQALSYFYIPLSVLLLTHTIQHRFRLRISTCADLFCFTVALDIGLIANGRTVTRINRLFQPYFVQLFIIGWLASAVLLANSIYVQSLLGKSGRVTKSYPAEKVAVCWFFAFVMMSFHLFALLGG
jgi:hypothetical protein